MHQFYTNACSSICLQLLSAENHSIFSRSVIKSLSIIILVKNHNLSLALDNQAVKSLSIQLIEQLNQLNLQSQAHCLYSKVSFYRQHWAFICLLKQSAYFFHLQIFIVLFLFLKTLNWFISVCQDSDQIWHYKLLFYSVLCFVEKSLQFIFCKSHSTLQIVWCSNKTTVDEFLVNLVKIIDENSSNLINQQFSKLLRTAELWSIHDRNWSSLKLEQRHNFTDLSAFSFQQVRTSIYSNNHQSV